MKSPKPTVEIISHTPHPIETVSYLVKLMHAEEPLEFPEYKQSVPFTECESDFEKIAEMNLNGPLEFITFNIVFRNVSRAFQQQFTRYRIGIGYFIQSMRNADASNAGVTMQSGMDEEQQRTFKRAADHSMLSYQWLKDNIKGKKATEIARGILPMNIHSHIACWMSLRTLYTIAAQRMCYAHVQEEFQNVMVALHAELEKISPLMSKYMLPACDKLRKCNSFDNTCGRWPKAEGPWFGGYNTPNKVVDK